MTRMWMLPPRVLCREHLLGEHKEVHQLVGTLENHDHGQAIAEGHAERGQVDTSLLQVRHDALAQEMERRDYAHDSPMTYVDEADLGSVDVRESAADLRERCEDCAERMRQVAEDPEQVLQLSAHAPHELEGGSEANFLRL